MDAWTLFGWIVLAWLLIGAGTAVGLYVAATRKWSLDNTTKGNLGGLCCSITITGPTFLLGLAVYLCLSDAAQANVTRFIEQG